MLNSKSVEVHKKAKSPNSIRIRVPDPCPFAIVDSNVSFPWTVREFLRVQPIVERLEDMISAFWKFNAMHLGLDVATCQSCSEELGISTEQSLMKSEVLLLRACSNSDCDEMLLVTGLVRPNAIITDDGYFTRCSLGSFVVFGIIPQSAKHGRACRWTSKAIACSLVVEAWLHRSQTEVRFFSRVSDHSCNGLCFSFVYAQVKVKTSVPTFKAVPWIYLGSSSKPSRTPYHVPNAYHQVLQHYQLSCDPIATSLHA